MVILCKSSGLLAGWLMDVVYDPAALSMRGGASAGGVGGEGSLPNAPTGTGGRYNRSIDLQNGVDWFFPKPEDCL